MKYDLVTKYKSYFDECSNKTELGKWHMKKIGIKTYEFPWLEKPIELREFISDFYKSDIAVSDYIEYLEKNNLNNFDLIELSMGDLNIEDLCAILTMVIRQDRFNEGLLVSKIIDGFLFKIIERLEKVVGDESV